MGADGAALSMLMGCLLVLGGGGFVGAQTSLFREDFSTDPVARGWSTFGDTNLFRWDAQAQALAVTWDSSRTNSFFGRSLGTILSQKDDFSFSVDLRLHDINVGATPGKSNGFEIAVGLINSVSATNANAFRGAGQSAAYGVRNVVEFDYFPDAGFGDTFASTVISTNNRIFPAHTFPLELSTGDTFRITFSYTAEDQTLRPRATRNGAPYGLPPDNSLIDLVLTGTPDFRVDTFAVISYSDAIQAGALPIYGSILAHGSMDNVEIHLPAPPVEKLALRQFRPTAQIEFTARTNWSYVLERSVALRDWQRASAPLQLVNAPGPSASLTLVDTNPPPGSVYYRVRAFRP